MSSFKYNTPKRKDVENHANSKFIHEYGKIALMCPECFHMVKTDIFHSKMVHDIIDKVEDFIITNEYYGMYPNCNEDVKFEEIDINMSQIINILITKGYYTAYCCEGHIKPDDYDGTEDFSIPYIYFYFWEDSDILNTNPLPNTWYISENNKKCKIFCIYDNIITTMPKSIIDCNVIFDIEEYIIWLKNYWDQRKRLEDIYNWAVSLPDKSEGEKEYLRSILKNSADSILEDNANRIFEMI